MNAPTVSAALLREGAIVAPLLGAGITTLSKADTDDSGLLVSAFFSLSIGLERIHMSLTKSIVEDAALTWFGDLGYAVGIPKKTGKLDK